MAISNDMGTSPATIQDACRYQPQ